MKCFALITSFFLSVLFNNCQAQQNDRVYVGGQLAQPVPGMSDTLILSYWKHLPALGTKSIPDVIDTQIVCNGNFRFLLKGVKQFGYIQLKKSEIRHGLSEHYPVLEHQVVESGDSVALFISDQWAVAPLIAKNGMRLVRGLPEVSFGGRNFQKYLVQYQIYLEERKLKKIRESLPQIKGVYEVMLDSLRKRNVRMEDSILRVQERFLQLGKATISRKAYAIMSMNLESKNLLTKLEYVIGDFIWGKYELQGGSLTKEDYETRTKYSINWYLFELFPRVKKLERTMDSLLAYSFPFIATLVADAKIQSYIEPAKNVYEIIKSKYQSRRREMLLTNYLVTTGYENIPGGNERASEIFADALSIVTSPYYSDYLNLIVDHQAIGKRAYDFALEDTSGKIVRLSDFKGKVVLLDFWYTSCTACAEFFKNVMHKAEIEYKHNPNVAFITINGDLARDKWITSLNKGIYTSPEIVNLTLGALGEQQPVLKQYMVTYYPRPYLIDKNGNILSNSINELRYYEPLRRKIEQALAK